MSNEIQKARIASCYNQEDNFEKGGKVAFIGEIRNFGGRDYIKTHDGWKFHGKGTGEKAQAHVASSSESEHDHLRTSDLSKYHDIMSSDIRKYIEKNFPDTSHNDDIFLSNKQTEDVFDFIGKKFKLPKSEVERQIRGINSTSKYGITFNGNMGLFNISMKKATKLEQKVETKKEPTFSEKYPGNTPELKPNHFSISGFLYHITNVTDKNIMYENTRRYSTRSERMTLKDFFERIDRGVVKYNKLPRLEEALSKVATSESDAYKNMILDLKNQTTGLKEAYIAKTKVYREGEFDRLVNKYGKYTYEDYLAKFPGGRFGISKEGESLRAKVGSMKREGKEKYIKGYMNLAEMHYNQSLEKLGLKITEAGFDTNKVKLSSSSVGVNFSTEVTDGNKYMRAYTIIAEGPIIAPHYRYLFTSNKKK